MNESLQLWEQIALGAIIVAVMIFALPRIRAGRERTNDDGPKDWTGFLIPIGLVVLFVFVLIQLA